MVRSIASLVDGARVPSTEVQALPAVGRYTTLGHTVSHRYAHVYFPRGFSCCYTFPLRRLFPLCHLTLALDVGMSSLHTVISRSTADLLKPLG
jgi:hypothetical protein